MSGTFQPRNTASTSARTHGGTSPVATGPISDTKPGLIDIKWFEQGVPANPEHRPDIETTLSWLDGHPERLGIIVEQSPNRTQIKRLVDLMNLDPLLAEDLAEGHQRPKLERHGEALFLVLHPPFYIDSIEDVAFVEAEVIKQRNCVVVIMQRIPDELSSLRWTPRLPKDEELLRHGPESVLYTILDGVVDQTFPVISGIQFDIEQIERQVFSGDSAAPERIYRLSREAIDLQHATNPLIPVIAALRAGSAKHQVPPELQAYLADVADHLARISSQITDIRELLTQILTVNATLVDQRSNEDLKIISGWAAILVVPTLIGSIYGMNFDNMPELHWKFGYLCCILSMVASSGILYVIFRKNNWL